MIRGAAGSVAESLRAMVAVFANRDLGRLQLSWAGMSFSLWAFAIALGVYAFEIGGPAAVGVIGLVRLLPGAFASPVAGVLGDRYSRRAVLAASAVATAAVLAATTAAASLDAPVAIVFILAAAFTIASSPYVPAEGALLPLVEIFEDRVHCRTEGPGESFGEIALLRDVPRTATVRASCPTRLLALDREQFLSAVTGYGRSREAAGAIIDSRLAGSRGLS